VETCQNIKLKGINKYTEKRTGLNKTAATNLRIVGHISEAGVFKL
jgi:hypothetical protein